jgi:hypothetical protein
MRRLTTAVPWGWRTGGAIALSLALVVSPGCSGAGSKGKSSGGAVKIGEIDPDSAITVDGGRVSVRSPMGWRRGARSDDYVVRYTPGQQKSFPSVVVLGGDPPAGFSEVTVENHKAFVAAVAEQLAETFSKGGKSTLLKKTAAVTLGPHLGAAWAAPGTAKVSGIKEPIERSCVAIVFAGRMYTVEARAPKGKLDDAGRAAARGVAAGIAGPVETPANETEPAAEPEKPAEEPAAEPAA